MEFWGIEVKAGQPIKADPGAEYVIHLSQASLGESKNKAESVPLYVNANGKKLVLGTLSHQNCPQLSFDLVFDQEFELSHNWKNGSVYFLGYKSYMPEEGYPFINYNSNSFFNFHAFVFFLFTDISSDEESSDEEELPLAAAENGKANTDAKTAKANVVKPEAVKQAVKVAEPSKKTKDEDNDDDDSEDESGSEDEDDSEDEDESDEMSMDDSSDDEDEETPKKVESSKKRPAETATPASSKKAKSAVTPQKTDGKKGGHTATPHPAKQAGKNSAKSPKSGGQFSCGSCSKSFGSEGGLDSHKKAKHGGK
ncbi:histone deacetylase 2B, ARABIDOPSIS HISTONE DEACETYLASE 2, HISTONE DEACETYLASE 2 [Hibiscus trionum]|uniref:Histone deacetylase 2B, ARABIDOPSIS HISTONE DEACETYLASE 2, HISTONE DEACETYLASE 2 n=1 Tax=Hibiscus trionum TaxID=183268 RepID=A0A9W7IBC3_HIBTR|nr:histone deacetylase 2B, ARABIDOPSIS HISTONE DEACETYLASE 2, HISTONE DEACETYLASE 2 [Hibiscus trionum]